jgi:glutamine synthetase
VGCPSAKARRSIRPSPTLSPAPKDWAIESGATIPIGSNRLGINESTTVSRQSSTAKRSMSFGQRVEGRADASASRPEACVPRSGGQHGVIRSLPPWPSIKGTCHSLRSADGEAVDKKTSPLMEALSKQAVRVLKLFGSRPIASSRPADPSRIFPHRPQLISRDPTSSTRADALRRETAEGAGSRWYFGAIADRAMAFMSEVETELYKIGVPVVDTSQRGRASQ